MAAQPAVKAQMHRAASTASQQDARKGNFEKICEGLRFEKKKKSFLQKSQFQLYSLTEKRCVLFVTDMLWLKLCFLIYFFVVFDG